MTDKQFRRLTRAELIEIIYELQKREKEYQAELETLHHQAEDLTLKLSNAGSIAEAALGLSGVFEAAQAAADRYLAEISQIRTEALADADRIRLQAKEDAAKIVEAAELQRDAIQRQIDEDLTRWARTASGLPAQEAEELDLDALKEVLTDET